MKKTQAEPPRKVVHEVHGLSNTPVIFHHDTVRVWHSCANWHENVEILLFTEGRGVIICEGEETQVSPGDIGVIDSRMLHRMCPEDEMSYHCLIVDETFCRKNGLAPGDMCFPRRIRDEALCEKYNKVATTFKTDDSYREARLRAAVLDFMVALMSGYATPAAVVRGVAESPVRTAVGYIHSHYHEQIDLDTLAATVKLSKYHFLREFKAATGQTPVAYINTVRIKRAERLLREGGMTVAEVAEACGFVSHSYFSKVFYRLQGVLPSALAAKRD